MAAYCASDWLTGWLTGIHSAYAAPWNGARVRGVVARSAIQAAHVGRVEIRARRHARRWVGNWGKAPFCQRRLGSHAQLYAGGGLARTGGWVQAHRHVRRWAAQATAPLTVPCYRSIQCARAGFTCVYELVICIDINACHTSTLFASAECTCAAAVRRCARGGGSTPGPGRGARTHEINVVVVSDNLRKVVMHSSRSSSSVRESAGSTSSHPTGYQNEVLQCAGSTPPPFLQLSK